ncbi:hypothetical protein [Aquisalibacillus elongatus]|nr:hypothetical protein [Aquisalibacillus elongatus]
MELATSSIKLPIENHSPPIYTIVLFKHTKENLEKMFEVLNEEELKK